VASLSANVTLTGMRADPLLREAFLVPDSGKWRPPRVNETCCRRPQLAALLRSGAVHIEQDCVLLSGFAALRNHDAYRFPMCHHTTSQIYDPGGNRATYCLQLRKTARM
jgi:hypothetical protein